MPFSQDCGNKLVESGCVSQEEVIGIKFYLIASVVDVFINVNVRVPDQVCELGCPKKNKSPNFGMPLTPVVFIESCQVLPK